MFQKKLTYAFIATTFLVSIQLSGCSDDGSQLEEATSTERPVIGSEVANDQLRPPSGTQKSTMEVKDDQLLDAQPDKVEVDAKAVKQNEEVAPQAETHVQASVVSGEQLYITCVGCHGATGEGGVGPKLAGLSQETIIENLLNFKAGKNKGPMSAMMIPNAQQLSDDDISAVAEYIAGF